ncbi:AMP-binding protein [Sphaerisporangium flaviroseum]|uniref:AMP-binding protein n=1 Tax=Sphaerisporangium flaviroseum TaxID=509199 RepID=A0ABP7I355_9ACTN
MTGSIVNHIVTTPPTRGRLTVMRLDGTETVELPDLYERAGRLAAHLREQGIGPGDRIGILAANSLEWVLLDLAALRLKAVTAGLEPGKFDADGELLARYDLKVLFTDQPAEHPGVRPIGEARRAAERPAASGALPPVAYAPGEVTTLKFTSGSTGQPKGLAATVGSIDSSMRAVQEMFAHGPGDELFVFLPLSLLQQRYWVYSALRHGHDITISTYEAAFWALPQVRPTVVMGVPAFFETAKKHIEARTGEGGVAHAARRMFGDRIRYLWTGSAPASAPMLRFFNEAGLPIYEGYGLNETCIVSKNHPGASREGSVGQVLPGKQVILDEAGVISVRCDHPVNRRYEYAAPGDSERMFGPDGVVRTGDLGYVDEDGFLFIRGRADDVIVLDNGKKIIVRPIEELMRESPAIEECVLFCPTQTSLVAVVSPAAEPADEAAIHEHLALANATLGRDEQISGIVIAESRFSIDNNLLTSQFKPQRRRIFDLYRSRILESHRGVHARSH